MASQSEREVQLEKVIKILLGGVSAEVEMQNPYQKFREVKVAMTIEEWGFINAVYGKDNVDIALGVYSGSMDNLIDKLQAQPQAVVGWTTAKVHAIMQARHSYHLENHKEPQHVYNCELETCGVLLTVLDQAGIERFTTLDNYLASYLMIAKQQHLANGGK